MWFSFHPIVELPLPARQALDLGLQPLNGKRGVDLQDRQFREATVICTTHWQQFG